MSNELEENLPDSHWFVYIILASDNSFYTGITTDIKRRWQQHNGAAGGARFFRGRKPIQLIYLEAGHDRSSASKREATIKKLKRRQKKELLESDTNQLVKLSQNFGGDLMACVTGNMSMQC